MEAIAQPAPASRRDALVNPSDRGETWGESGVRIGSVVAMAAAGA